MRAKYLEVMSEFAKKAGLTIEWAVRRLVHEAMGSGGLEGLSDLVKNPVGLLHAVKVTMEYAQDMDVNANVNPEGLLAQAQGRGAEKLWWTAPSRQSRCNFENRWWD